MSSSEDARAGAARADLRHGVAVRAAEGEVDGHGEGEPVGEQRDSRRHAEHELGHGREVVALEVEERRPGVQGHDACARRVGREGQDALRVRPGVSRRGARRQGWAARRALGCAPARRSFRDMRSRGGACKGLWAQRTRRRTSGAGLRRRLREDRAAHAALLLGVVDVQAPLHGGAPSFAALLAEWGAAATEARDQLLVCPERKANAAVRLLGPHRHSALIRFFPPLRVEIYKS